MKKYCLALDLKEDEQAIKAYDDYHKKVWPEVKESLKEAGILDMEIYRTHNRLFMIIKVVPDFSFEKKGGIGSGQSKSAGMGKPDVPISKTPCLVSARKKMAPDGACI